VVGRPENISRYRDTIHEMVMRAIEKPRQSQERVLRIDIRGGGAETLPDERGDPEVRSGR
jgi:hypothetical protein